MSPYYYNSETQVLTVDGCDESDVRHIKASAYTLAALRDLIEQLEGIGIPDWHGAEGLDLDQARAAIDKAEGRT